jgi:hypothetical protein
MTTICYFVCFEEACFEEAARATHTLCQSDQLGSPRSTWKPWRNLPEVPVSSYKLVERAFTKTVSGTAPVEKEKEERKYDTYSFLN